VTLQKRRPVATTLLEAKVAGNTSGVDVDQQLPIEWEGGDSLPDVPLPDVPFTDVPIPDIHPPDDPLPDDPLPEARPDGSVGEE